MAKKCDKLTTKQRRQLIEQQEKRSEQEYADWLAIESLVYGRRPGQDCRGGRRVIRKLILDDRYAI